MSQRPARKAYSAEELLALRRSASDDAASVIEKRATEGAIRDHVVRGSRSNDSRSASSTLPPSRHRSQLADGSAHITGPILGEIDPNNHRPRFPVIGKDSPTASIKKKAAEHILQQHGSPPHIRVTAGGRIVPSEQSPLCSPRYGYSAIHRNGGLIKFAPGYPPPLKTFPNIIKALPNGFVAQDPSGKLCQVVDGQLLIIPEVDGIPQLYITAPNVTNMAWAQHYGTASNKSASPSQGLPSATKSEQSMPGPSVATQVAALEKQYQKLEAERRTLDKTEVLKRSELTGKAYNQLIQKRRELVNRQDELRRSIKTLQETRTSPPAKQDSRRELGPHPQLNHLETQPVALPTMTWPHMMPGNEPSGPFLMPGIMPEIPILYPQGLPGLFPPYVPMQHFGRPVPPELLGLPENSASPLLPHTGNHGHNTTASFAMINLKDGDHSAQASRHDVKSFLNPMSPAYQPAAAKELSVEPDALESKTLQMGTAVYRDANSQAKHDTSPHPSAQRESSEASFATADFFPHNPRDHSLKKHTYAIDIKAPQSEHEAQPPPALTPVDDAIAQPELELHNASWNPTIPDQAFRPAHEEDKPGMHSATKVDNEGSFARGFKAGLQRAPVGDELDPGFIDGYCKGLLHASQQRPIVPDSPPVSTKPVVRLPSTTADRSVAKTVHQAKPHGVPDVMPEIARFKPTNASEGSEQAASYNQPLDLVRPATAGGSIQRASVLADPHRRNAITDENAPPEPNSFFSVPARSSSEMQEQHASRTFSAQTQPSEMQSSYLQRLYPGVRVLSTPGIDHKAAHTGLGNRLTTGYFAQFDGTSSKPSNKGNAVHSSSPTKVREASTPEDGPQTSPAKSSMTSSPKKSISPAKAKFAAIAGKAGIKVRMDRPQSKESNDLEPMSPKERRRWRDVWKNRNMATD